MYALGDERSIRADGKRSGRRRGASTGGFRGVLRALGFRRELPRHPEVAHLRREGLALLQDIDRTRYLALGKQIAGLAEDLGIAMPFFGWSHESRNGNP